MTKNSIIEFQVTFKSTKNIIENEASGRSYMHFWQIHSSTKRVRLDMVRKSHIRIDIDKNRELFFYEHKIEEPKITYGDLVTTYEWNVLNLKNVKLENGVLESYTKKLPHLNYSTIKDWGKINRFFTKYFSEASTPTESIKKLAYRLTKNAKTEHENVVSIYNYMQKNIKYIFAHFGKGGMIPHKAKRILSNLYGDCKDQTVLFIALLKAVNIEAFPSLLSTRTDQILDNNTVSPKLFNHVITYIPSERTWVDTTGHATVYPGLSWQENNQKTLLLNGKDSSLRKITFNDFQTINGKVVLKDLGEKIVGSFYFQPTGDVSSYYKFLISNSQDSKKSIQNSFNQLYQNSNIKNFEFLNLNNPSKYFEIKFDFEISPSTLNAEDLRYFNSVLPFLISMVIPVATLEKPNDRVYGYTLGYKIKLHLETLIYPQSKAVKASFKTIPSSYKAKFYNYDFSYDINSEKIKIEDTVTLHNNKISREEYDTFYRESKELLSNTSWLLETKKDKFQEEEFQLKEELSRNNSSEKQMELIEHFLSSASYEKAKKAVESLLKNEPNNGKAHYLYGVVLGYTDEFEKSDLEFDKAQSLGY